MKAWAARGRIALLLKGSATCLRTRRKQVLPTNSRRFQSTEVAPKHVADRLWASFWRGGTSKGVFIAERSLPFKWTTQEDFQMGLQRTFRSVLGSPDKYGRQLNGLGGGLSSLSKAVIYKAAPEGDEEADVEYLFIQLGIKDGKLDLSGNCGNLSSVVGPLALNEGYAKLAPVGEGASGDSKEITVRLRNLNTSKIIHSISSASGVINEDSRWNFKPDGDYSIDGVSGTASKVLLQFTKPGGAKTGQTLPTRNAVDVVKTSDDSVEASLVDVTNPGIFVDGTTLGWKTEATPDQLNAQTDLMRRLELIRKRGTEMMGLEPNDSAVPKIVLVYPPASADVDISCQALSMEQAHKAVPGTLALNLAAACKLPGTIPNRLARTTADATVIIGHPSGRAVVGANVKDGVVESVELGRTARCLMEGWINCDE